MSLVAEFHSNLRDELILSLPRCPAPPPPPLCSSDLGYGRPGAVPVFRRGVLPRRRLLRPGFRRHGTKHLQDSGQLEGRVLDPGQPSRPREFPLCGAGQQDRLREQTGESRKCFFLWRVLECLNSNTLVQFIE